MWLVQIEKLDGSKWNEVVLIDPYQILFHLAVNGQIRAYQVEDYS